MQSIAVVAGVSIDCGLDAYLMAPKSINSQKFIEFLEILQQSNPGKKLAIFADNCRVHHSKAVKKYTEQQDIFMIFNLPYSP